MCDVQVLIGPDAVWFAKNSDREPGEPQPVMRLPAVVADDAATVRATYVELPQVPRRHGVILSRPVWCWGAEMGVNDKGVAIGNAAIFSRRATRAPALLGMDLVRLGLERGGTAGEALEVIIRLLEQHGQGGPTGFRDKAVCHDASFLIADALDAWVLETAGRDWVARRVTGHYAISDAFTIGTERELRSSGVAAGQDFARTFDTRLRPWLAGARARRALSLHHLGRAASPSFARMAFHLRAHARNDEDPADGSNADVCMHAAGLIRRRQTTGSMIARLTASGPTALFTGTSAPCLSIFRPAAFDGEFSVLTPADKQVAALLWRRHELLHRHALDDASLRLRLRATRDEIEAKVFEQLAAAHPDAGALVRADRLAAAWHKVLWESLNGRPARRGTRFWRRVSEEDGLVG
ncbi:MAG: C69 family dipeptidase [Gammaproteobacteria bacterium]